ncbi:synemin [Pyxicephalus adspersus]|uniref:synemin n=1 Tax=Pyxicephalus adspersus TaxID=30357 RepID=UPI003B5C7D52
MLYVRRGFGDEKSQLNELNRRLDQYLSRVRELESENQHLLEEIQKLRLERGAEWAQVYHTEVCELRNRIEELSIQKGEAELQRDNLLQDLQELQELWEQVRNMRLKIDQQLANYKQDLQQAQKSQAAMEQLYIQLQQEYQMLQGSHEEEMLALRDQALQMPFQVTMQEVLRPKLSSMDVQSFSLELSESWKDVFVFYQKKIEELESILRLSEEDRQVAEDEAAVQKLQVDKLHKEYEELLAIKAMLEDELLRMRGKYRLEVEEYQVIIEQLEAERKTITVNITERLKDYHDLMQAKTGLSLEVAAYRALLEAESKKGDIIITEHIIRDRPAGYVTSTLEETTRISNRGRDKFEYPISKSKDEIRWKAQTADAGRIFTRTVPQTQISSRYTNLGNTSSSYGSNIYETTSHERFGRWDSHLPKYDYSHKSEATPAAVYQTVQPKSVSSSTHSTIFSQTSQQEQEKDQKPVARPRTHSKESRRGRVDNKVEHKQQESDSQKTLATEVVKDSKPQLQSVKEAKHVVEGDVKITTNENRKNYDETVSVTETVQKETIHEPKTQELPVKKERKKREQAKKRKEEQENVAIDDMNVTGGSRVEVHETTQVKKTTVHGDKTNDQPIVYEIPIKFEERKQKDIEDHSTHQKEVGEYGKTNFRYEEKKTLVDDYLKQLGQSSAFDLNETNISLGENNQSSRYIKTFVLGEKSEDKQVVMEIPIQLEENRKETESKKENAEESGVLENVNKMNVSKEESLGFDDKDEIHKIDTNEFSTAKELSSISSETIEKKALVTDILKKLGHPSDLDDANVTYVEQKQKCTDGSVKTEIVVESKMEEEIDLFDEPDLTDLWNSTSTSISQKSEAASIPQEDIQSRKIKKTILEDISGAEAEEWIGNVIHTGLKGSPGKSVNVEIVEETFGTFVCEKGDYSTPFHVEEAEDNYDKEESVNTEEMAASFTKDQIPDDIQSTKSPAQVEEIPEGEHVDIETDYLVFIPDDSPYLEEEEEETIRGQIHTEEESHVKFSWQDEFLQGSQGRKSLSEMLKQATATEQSSGNYKTTTDYSDTLDKEELKEASHVDTIVIEKTNIYESSVDREDELQNQQQTEESHFETFSTEKATTYGSSVDSSDSFDLKNHEGQLHVKTIRIEKEENIGSLTDNSERLDSKEPKGESNVETVVIEKQIKASPEIQSSIISLLSKDINDPQQKLKGALDCLQGNLPEELVKELSALAEEDQTQTSSLAVDIKKFGQTDKSGIVTILAEINVSKTLDPDNLGDFDLNKIIESEERTIHKSQAMSHEDVIPELQKEVNTALFENKTNISKDNSVTVRMNNKEESYISEENVVNIPTTTSVHFSPTREVPFEQISTDVSKFIKHLDLDTHGQMFQEESASVQSSAASFSPTEANRSEHHIKLTAKEPLFNKQIIFEGPISETLKLDILKDTEETSEQNRSIRHIKISPTENVSTKQIIFEGPISETLKLDIVKNTEETSEQNRSIRHVKISPTENVSTKQIIFEGPISETLKLDIVKDTEETLEQNRTIRHIKISPTESVPTEQVIFEGPISETLKLDIGKNTEEASEQNRSIRHIKISPTESVSTEQIIFQGPLFKTVGTTGELSVQEKHVDHVNQATKSMVFERFQVGSQETTSHSTVSHFKVNSGESFSKQVMFEGSIPKIQDFSRPSILKFENLEDETRPIEHSSAAQKINVAKQVKYQGFVSEQRTGEDYGNIEEQNKKSNVNTSVHHIKLSPSKEQIVFEGPISAKFHIGAEDKAFVDDTNRSIRHIRLGSPEAQLSEHVTFEGPTTESFETSDFFVSSPSGDSTDSERSIKHIKLGPQEKSFTFQMDITKFATKHSEERAGDGSGTVITSSQFEGQPEFSQSSTELMDDTEVAESGYGEEEIAGVSQFAYEIQPNSQNITKTSELEKTIQVQSIMNRSNMISGEKKVAIVFLDEEEEEEEEEEEDQDYLRRSF